MDLLAKVKQIGAGGHLRALAELFADLPPGTVRVRSTALRRLLDTEGGIMGNFHKVSTNHLPLYVAEFKSTIIT